MVSTGAENMLAVPSAQDHSLGLLLLERNIVVSSDMLHDCSN